MALDDKKLFLTVSANTDDFKRQMALAEDVVSAFGTGVSAELDKVERKFGSMKVGQLGEGIRAQRSQFEREFDAIRAAADKALGSGASSAGALNLDVSSLRASQEAAQQQAIAIREIGDAAERAARAVGDESEATRLYIQAARAAAIAADGEAAAFGNEARAAELLQAQLDAAGVSTARLQSAHGRAVVSSGQMRAASQQLSYQISDVATSFAGGVSPMVIFAQQGSQVVQAMSLMRAESTGFVGFLSGPWGAALLGAASLIGVLASRHHDAEDATGKHETAARSLADALRDLTGAASGDITTQEARVRQAGAEVIALTNQEIATRKLTKARLEAALADVQARKNQLNDPINQLDGGTTGSLIGGTIAERAVATLQAQVKASDQALQSAERGLRAGAAFLARSDIAADLDKRTAAVRRHTEALAALTRQYQRDGDLSSYKRAVLGEDTRSGAELRSLDASKRTGRSTAAKPKASFLDELAAQRGEVGSIVSRISFKPQATDAERLKHTTGIDVEGDFATMMAEINDRATEARAARDQAFSDVLDRPMAKFRDEIHKSSGDMSVALEGVEVNALRNLESGLLGVITGTESVGKAFKNMAQSIVADLAKIAIERAIITPLADALFPGGGAGVGILSGIGSLLSGKRAAGGPVDRNGLYLVGERGPELFSPGIGGNIIPNHALPRMSAIGGRGGGNTVHVNVDARGASDPAAVQKAVAAGIQAAAPHLVQASVDRTVSVLSRPRL